MTEFAKNTIRGFWDWVSEYKEYLGVQYRDEENFWLYVAFDHGMMNEFTDRYQYQCEEGGCKCLMLLNGLCFNMVDLEGGYDFTMKDLWEHRPEGIEDTMGDYIY